MTCLNIDKKSLLVVHGNLLLSYFIRDDLLNYRQEIFTRGSRKLGAWLFYKRLRGPLETFLCSKYEEIMHTH